MRHLVYRVKSLPQSMIPLVWDFGRLSSDVEEKYICQMIHKYVCIRISCLLLYLLILYALRQWQARSDGISTSAVHRCCLFFTRFDGFSYKKAIRKRSDCPRVTVLALK